MGEACDEGYEGNESHEEGHEEACDEGSRGCSAHEEACDEGYEGNESHEEGHEGYEGNESNESHEEVIDEGLAEAFSTEMMKPWWGASLGSLVHVIDVVLC